MKYLFYPLILLFIAVTVVEFIPISVYVASNLAAYKWLFYGMIGYFVLRITPLLSRNESWAQTFSHELSHTVVGMMFLQKIHSFHADEDTGVIWHSGKGYGRIFISLAPYCLPIYTYAFILLRLMGASNMLYIFDIIIGVTLAFHIVCFWKQTKPYQTDIQGQGYLRSYLFIVAFWVFNASVILLSIRKGVVDAVVYLFPRYWGSVVSWSEQVVEWCKVLF